MSIWKRPRPTPLRKDFFEGRCVNASTLKIAIATFRGEAAASHQLIHVFSAIEESATTLLESEQPAALILDFRELRYEWGDEMARTLGELSWRDDREFAVAIITSNLNQAGLTSLLQDEMFLEPSDWLFDSELKALTKIQSKLSLSKSS